MSKTEESKITLNEFYEKMLERAKQEQCTFFRCNTGNLQLYSIIKESKFQHFLFIKVSLSTNGFWGLLSDWLELIHEITIGGVLDGMAETPPPEVRNWAAILLTGSQRGFFIPSSDLLKMRPDLSIDQKGEIKIVESKINTRYQFWTLKKLLEKISQLKGLSST